MGELCLQITLFTHTDTEDLKSALHVESYMFNKRKQYRLGITKPGFPSLSRVDSLICTAMKYTQEFVTQLSHVFECCLAFSGDLARAFYRC